KGVSRNAEHFARTNLIRGIADEGHFRFFAIDFDDFCAHQYSFQPALLKRRKLTYHAQAPQAVRKQAGLPLVSPTWTSSRDPRLSAGRGIPRAQPSVQRAPAPPFTI